MSTMSTEMQAFAVETIFPLMGYVRTTEQIVSELRSGSL